MMMPALSKLVAAAINLVSGNYQEAYLTYVDLQSVHVQGDSYLSYVFVVNEKFVSDDVGTCTIQSFHLAFVI